MYDNIFFIRQLIKFELYSAFQQSNWYAIEYYSTLFNLLPLNSFTIYNWTRTFIINDFDKLNLLRTIFIPTSQVKTTSNFRSRHSSLKSFQQTLIIVKRSKYNPLVVRIDKEKKNQPTGKYKKKKKGIDPCQIEIILDKKSNAAGRVREIVPLRCNPSDSIKGAAHIPTPSSTSFLPFGYRKIL